MTEDQERFLREGLFRYAEAKSTIQAFTQLLEEQLLLILRSRANWGEFAPLAKQLGRQVDTSRSATDWYVYAWLDGAFRNRTVRLMIGVQWPGEVLFYLECWEPESRKWLQWETSADLPHGISINGRKFVLSPSRDVVLADEFPRLVDVALRSLADATAV